MSGRKRPAGWWWCAGPIIETRPGGVVLFDVISVAEGDPDRALARAGLAVAVLAGAGRLPDGPTLHVNRMTAADAGKVVRGLEARAADHPAPDARRAGRIGLGLDAAAERQPVRRQLSRGIVPRGCSTGTVEGAR